jgi:putative LysE/RhtB family amino acid efflux pump
MAIQWATIPVYAQPMEIASLAKGAWLGICIAAPVGPIGTLVLKQSLRSGFRAGLVSGFGAALADLCYGALAAAGVRLVAGFARPVAIVGGLILFWLAWKSWHEQPPAQSGVVTNDGRLRSVGTTFLLTISNPMTILSFAAMISTVGADYPALFVAGVFLGSMIWWTVLSAFSSWLGTRMELNPSILNRLAAVTLACFGVWGLVMKGLR